jgi:hypothetical protein
MMSSMFGDEMMTVLVSGIALVAVLLPLTRGLRVVMGGWRATRRVSAEELRQGKPESATGTEPLALLMLRVLQKSLREGEQEGQSSDFVFDATRQYIVNEYDHHYSRLITMYASLLPPIGFIGTTGGMLILFLSMHLANDSLELGALAIALTSSVFALIAYAGLEGLKIRLYTRLLDSIRDVEALYHQAGSRREQAQGPRLGMQKQAATSA